MLGLFFACRKKEPQPELTSLKKSCDCVQEVNADFVVGETFFDSIVDMDTIPIYIDYSYNQQDITGCNVHFSAKFDNAESYEWRVGAEQKIRTDKKFNIYFYEAYGTISITLIVKAKPNLICHPNDDGIDTITKTITITTERKPYLWGKYSGYNLSDPSTIFTIEIDTFTFQEPNNNGRIDYGIKNLPIGANFITLQGYNSIGFLWTYDQSFFENGRVVYQKPWPSGVINHKTNAITIKYSAKIYDKNINLIKDIKNETFIGKKL
jgi:hypothetical protein